MRVAYTTPSLSRNSSMSVVRWYVRSTSLLPPLMVVCGASFLQSEKGKGQKAWGKKEGNANKRCGENSVKAVNGFWVMVHLLVRDVLRDSGAGAGKTFPCCEMGSPGSL